MVVPWCAGAMQSSKYLLISQVNAETWAKALYLHLVVVWLAMWAAVQRRGSSIIYLRSNHTPRVRNFLDFMQSVMALTSTAARWVENVDCKARDQPCEDEAEPQIIEQLKLKGIKNSLTLGHSSPVCIQSSSHITSVPQRVWICLYQASSLPSSKVWIRSNLPSCIYTAEHLHVWAGQYRSYVTPDRLPHHHMCYHDGVLHPHSCKFIKERREIL